MNFPRDYQKIGSFYNLNQGIINEIYIQNVEPVIQEFDK